MDEERIWWVVVCDGVKGVNPCEIFRTRESAEEFVRCRKVRFQLGGWRVVPVKEVHCDDALADKLAVQS